MLKIFSCLLSAIFGASALLAEENNPLGVSFYGSFLHTKNVPNALFFFGDIKENDSFELRKAIRNHNIDIVVLSSRGGSVWEGLNMAGIIYDKELKTYIPQQGINDEGNCASACSFMFFGGSTRIADGKLGVHQFYSGSAKQSADIGKTQRNAQFTVSEIIGFLNEFSTPPFVFERMFQQEDMYYFNQSELKEITRISDPLTDEEVNKIRGFIRDFNVELIKVQKKEASEVAEVSYPKTVKHKPEKIETEQVETVKELNPALTEIKPKELVKTEFTERHLIKFIQAELNKLNCGAGLADGIWGRNSKRAFDRLKKELPASSVPAEFSFKATKHLISNLPSGVKCSKVTSVRKIAQVPFGTYTHSTTCNGETRQHRVILTRPVSATHIPYNVTHSFDIDIKGVFNLGYYGLSNGLFGHWGFSGWVYWEENALRFKANAYATQYSETKAENNINAIYEIAADRKGYFGKDNAGCQVVGLLENTNQ